MSSTLPFKTSPQLNAQLGPLAVGLQVHLLLTGIIFCQASYYYTRFWPKREPWTKAVVAALLVVFGGKSVADILGLYILLIENFGNFSNFHTTISTPFKIASWLAIFPISLAQLWLLARVHTVSKGNLWLSCALLVPVVLTTVAGLISTSAQMRSPFQSPFLADSSDHIFFPLWIYAYMGTQLLLTGAFVISLYRLRPQTVHPRLREILYHLMNIAVKACVPTTCLSVLVAILSRTSPHTSAYLAFQVLFAPSQAISVLFTLNSRQPEEVLTEDRPIPSARYTASLDPGSQLDDARSTTGVYVSPAVLSRPWRSCNGPASYTPESITPESVEIKIG